MLLKKTKKKKMCITSHKHRWVFSKCTTIISGKIKCSEDSDMSKVFWRLWHEQTQKEQHSYTHDTPTLSHCHGCTHAAQKSETRRRAAQLHNSFSTYWCSDLLLLTFNLFMSIMSRPEILNPFSPQKPRPLKLKTFAYKSKMSGPIIFNHCHPKTPTTVLLFIFGGNMFWFRFHNKK